MSREQLLSDYAALSKYNKGFLHGWQCTSCEHRVGQSTDWQRGFTDGYKARVNDREPWSFFSELP